MALRVVLAVFGLALIAIALNTALGGMVTLGWQFPNDVLTVTDPQEFARHDNNARFFAGVFAGLGLVIVLGAVALSRLRMAIVAILLSIALGGLFRLFQVGYSPVSDMALLPSFLFEVLVSPALAYWVWRQRA